MGQMVITPIFYFLKCFFISTFSCLHSDDLSVQKVCIENIWPFNFSGMLHILIAMPYCVNWGGGNFLYF
jgi:hypothetical protein